MRLKDGLLMVVAIPILICVALVVLWLIIHTINVNRELDISHNKTVSKRTEIIEYVKRRSDFKVAFVYSDQEGCNGIAVDDSGRQLMLVRRDSRTHTIKSKIILNTSIIRSEVIQGGVVVAVSGRQGGVEGEGGWGVELRLLVDDISCPTEMFVFLPSGLPFTKEQYAKLSHIAMVEANQWQSRIEVLIKRSGSEPRSKM